VAQLDRVFGHYALRTAIRRFLQQLEADGRSPLTVSVYGRELRRFAEWHGMAKLAERIRPPVIAKYLTSRAGRESRGARATGERSARTLNRARTSLRQFFAYLEEAGAVRRSPARALRSARTDPPLPVALNEDEEKRFLHALDVAAGESDVGTRDRALFTLLLRSGMRLSAALALDVTDLDLASCSAISRHGKHGRVQTVYFPRAVATLLRRHLKETGIRRGPVFRSSRWTAVVPTASPVPLPRAR
jgi:site-specific recombinase XerD